MGDHIKQAYQQHHNNLWSQIKALWLTPLNKKHIQNGTFKSLFKNSKRYKMYILYSICCGIIGLGIFFKHFPQEGVFGLHHPNIQWQWQGLLVIIPAILLGWGFGYLFIKLGEIAQQIFNKYAHPIIKGILGGLLLIGAAFFTVFR